MFHLTRLANEAAALVLCEAHNRQHPNFNFETLGPVTWESFMGLAGAPAHFVFATCRDGIGAPGECGTVVCRGQGAPEVRESKDATRCEVHESRFRVGEACSRATALQQHEPVAIFQEAAGDVIDGTALGADTGPILPRPGAGNCDGPCIDGKAERGAAVRTRASPTPAQPICAIRSTHLLRTETDGQVVVLEPLAQVVRLCSLARALRSGVPRNSPGRCRQ